MWLFCVGWVFCLHERLLFRLLCCAFVWVALVDVVVCCDFGLRSVGFAVGYCLVWFVAWFVVCLLLAYCLFTSFIVLLGVLAFVDCGSDLCCWFGA